ncbi:hypothetical protein F0562_023873 [Nyssa sinensis]|uniref:Uncharacterized protein n=1 Tax=Nyssa sinensis TaxID=561372 RepID=A0A5J5BJ55_9ASTE|nr:hypothetical protein F0562_023873 [Nyssa sinensis]
MNDRRRLPSVNRTGILNRRSHPQMMRMKGRKLLELWRRRGRVDMRHSHISRSGPLELGNFLLNQLGLRGLGPNELGKCQMTGDSRNVLGPAFNYGGLLKGRASNGGRLQAQKGRAYNRGKLQDQHTESINGWPGGAPSDLFKDSMVRPYIPSKATDSSSFIPLDTVLAINGRNGNSEARVNHFDASAAETGNHAKACF